MPLVKKVYEGWAQSRNAKSSLFNVLKLLNQPLPLNCQLPPSAPLQLQHSIRFEDVHFAYAPTKGLTGLTIEVRRGERIGLIGSTGSGKSTTLDLLMGLLQPTCGRILIDNVDLYDKFQPQRLQAGAPPLAHVPQSIYLADCSIAENIAIGLRHIGRLSLVRLAAKMPKLTVLSKAVLEAMTVLSGKGAFA